jgi:hypothetical protein
LISRRLGRDVQRVLITADHDQLIPDPYPRQTDRQPPHSPKSTFPRAASIDPDPFNACMIRRV